MAKKSSKKVDMGQVLGVILGGAVASKISGINLPVIPEKARPALPLVVGFLLTRGKSGMAKAAGYGMIAVGGTKLIGAMVPSLGISGDEGVSDYLIEGAGNYALNGAGETLSGARPYSLAGTDSDAMNTDLNG